MHAFDLTEASSGRRSFKAAELSPVVQINVADQQVNVAASVEKTSRLIGVRLRRVGGGDSSCTTVQMCVAAFTQFVAVAIRSR